MAEYDDGEMQPVEEVMPGTMWSVAGEVREK